MAVCIGRSGVGSASHFLALDFGASSIRLIDVVLMDSRLAWSELARFDNAPKMLGNRQVWDYEAIYRRVGEALRTAGLSGVRYSSIGADSWGVDYVLIDEHGALLGPAVSYRDARTAGQIEHYVGKHLSAHALFSATGIQCLVFNTLFQLYAQRNSEPELLRRARRLLFTADYAHFWLSGIAANERTLASTSQMLTTWGHWLPAVVDSVGLPRAALAPPVSSGTVLGTIRSELAASSGLGQIPVVAPAAHDTQSAILSTPATGVSDWAYLSSGTWSILGVESLTPIITPGARAAGISNESGFGGTFCVQSTVAGLWLVQEIQRLLQIGDVAALAAKAERAAPFRSLVNPADPRFFSPADMVAEIRTACREADEPVPETAAELVRCAYDSLALLYRDTLRKLSAVSGRSFKRLHVFGGGSKAALLNRLCAATTRLPVYAGPSEATAIGNGLSQMIALGVVDNAEHGRALVRDSFPPARFEPSAMPELDDAVARFEQISARGSVNENPDA